MAKLFRRTMEYLGLIDEAEALQEESAARPHVTASSGAEPSVRTLDPAGPAKLPPAPSLHPTQTATGGRRVEPPQAPRRGPAMPGTGAGVVVGGHRAQAAPAVTVTGAESHVVAAAAFDDAKIIADHIKARTPVVLDLRSAEPDMVRRLVDFVTGLVYSLDGTMRKIAKGVILISPPRVTLSRTERRRLATLGLYESADTD